MNWKTKEFWIVAVLTLVTIVLVNILRYYRVSVKEQVNLTDIPMSFGDWRAENFYLDQKTLNVLKADETVWRKYSNSKGQIIWLFIAYFKDQKYGEQIHSPKHCLPGSGWKIIDRETHSINVRSSPQYRLKVNKLINSNDHYRDLMLYWFRTRGGIITSEFGLKFDLAKNALLRRPTDAAFIRINLPLSENNPAEALKLSSQFITKLFPAIKDILP